MTDIVLGLEPGLTTGYAAITLDDGNASKLVKFGEIKWDDRFQVGNLLKDLGVAPSGLAAIAVENFVLYAGKAKDQIGNTFPSAQMIGIIHTYCREFNLMHITTLQMASSRKRVQIEPHVKQAFKDAGHGSSQHVIDAYQHARLLALKLKLKK